MNNGFSESKNNRSKVETVIKTEYSQSIFGNIVHYKNVLSAHGLFFQTYLMARYIGSDY